MIGAPGLTSFQRTWRYATTEGYLASRSYELFQRAVAAGNKQFQMKCQVLDFNGQVIQGLHCGGESAGGCSQHGQGRAITQGFIAGKEAANETSWM